MLVSNAVPSWPSRFVLLELSSAGIVKVFDEFRCYESVYIYLHQVLLSKKGIIIPLFKQSIFIKFHIFSDIIVSSCGTGEQSGQVPKFTGLFRKTFACVRYRPAIGSTSPRSLNILRAGMITCLCCTIFSQNYKIGEHCRKIGSKI